MDNDPASMRDDRDVPQPPFDKALSEFTDAELLAEARARRLRRGLAEPASGTKRAARSAPATVHAPPPPERVRHLASLELEPDATADDVQAAYARLRAKYEPYLSHEDPERRAAAQSLLDSLSAAFEALQGERS